MKTKELIKLLQESDPNGEYDVCVDNLPVESVCAMDYYWDGIIEFVERDINGKPTDAGWRNNPNQKVRIYIDSVEKAVFDNPDLKIETSGLSLNNRDRYLKSLESHRQDGKKFAEFDKELRIDNFQNLNKSDKIKHIERVFDKYTPKHTLFNRFKRWLGI